MANYALGNAYYKGEGVEINYKLSFQSYLKSSILGHPAAKINLGNLYYQGKGTSKSYEKAMLWWMLAESQNINGARENLQMLDNVISKAEKQKGLSLYKKCLKITCPCTDRQFSNLNSVMTNNFITSLKEKLIRFYLNKNISFSCLP